jgi:hypothetical protein
MEEKVCFLEGLTHKVKNLGTFDLAVHWIYQIDVTELIQKMENRFPLSLKGMKSEV